MGIASFFHAPFELLFGRKEKSRPPVWSTIDYETMIRRSPLEYDLLDIANDDWEGAAIQSPANDCEPTAPRPSHR